MNETPYYGTKPPSIMLSERRQTQNTTNCMNPFTCSFEKERPNYKDGKLISGFLNLRKKKGSITYRYEGNLGDYKSVLKLNY